MRAVVQRVTRASVSVDGEVVGRIGPGLCVLVGVTDGDTAETAAQMARKLWQLRLFASPDGERSMDRSASEVGGEILVVSQFTLYGDARKGRRPSWTAAAPGAVAEPLVEAVASHLRSLDATVAEGRFGAHMQVELVNDGPVTLIVDV